MNLPYYEVHDGNGPPLLLVHGILSSRAQWKPNLEALKTVASPVILELYGHGRSAAPRGSDCYLPDSYVQAFESIREGLGVEQWSVLGYSLGAGLTLRYSIEHPDRITAGAFTNSTSAFSTVESRQSTLANAASIIQQYESGGLAAVAEIPVHPKFAKRIPEDIKHELLIDCELQDPGGIARTIVYTNGHVSVRDEIHNLEVPHMLLCGEKESRFQQYREFAELNIPGLKVTNLPAGHAVNMEAAQGFNDAMVEFLMEHTS